MTVGGDVGGRSGRPVVNDQMDKSLPPYPASYQGKRGISTYRPRSLPYAPHQTSGSSLYQASCISLFLGDIGFIVLLARSSVLLSER